MSFADLQWEERAAPRPIRADRGYEPMAELADIYTDLPTWSEVPTGVLSKKRPITLFDCATVGGYALVFVYFLADVVYDLLANKDGWLFAKTFFAILALLLMAGRLIEIRSQPGPDAL